MRCVRSGGSVRSPGADIDNLIEAFNEKYPNVEVEVVNGSAGELEARARAEKDNPQGDLQWGGLSPSDGNANDDIFALYTTAATTRTT